MARDNHESQPSNGQVAAEYLASIDDFSTDHGGYAVPGEFVVASARNPD